MDMDKDLGLLFSRQSPGTCSAGSIAEEATCVPEATCDGAFFPNQCGTGSECCFIRSCTVSEGSGMCKNDTRDACDGVFYTGDLSNAPCPGDSTIRCCVTFENMNNGTGGDGSSNSSDPPSSSNGLTGSQIGGIVGGVVGGVIAFAALFLILFFGCWRKRQRDHQVSVVEIPSDRDRKEEENSGRGIFMSEVEAREVGELDAGNERRELDGHGQAVYELEGVSPVDDRKQ